jgi:hypothetical protein
MRSWYPNHIFGLLIAYQSITIIKLQIRTKNLLALYAAKAVNRETLEQPAETSRVCPKERSRQLVKTRTNQVTIMKRSVDYKPYFFENDAG